MTDLSLEVTTYYQNSPGRLKTLFYSKPLLTAMLQTILEREILRLEREIRTPLEREDLELSLFLYSII